MAWACPGNIHGNRSPGGNGVHQARESRTDCPCAVNQVKQSMQWVMQSIWVSVEQSPVDPDPE
jgi:hypothetical protein